VCMERTCDFETLKKLDPQATHGQNQLPLDSARKDVMLAFEQDELQPLRSSPRPGQPLQKVIHDGQKFFTTNQ